MARYNFRLVIILFLFILISAAEFDNRCDVEAQKLSSSDPNIRHEALLNLTVEQNESGVEGRTFDLSDKYVLFCEIVKIDDVDYVCKAIKLLSRIPADKKLLDYTDYIVRKKNNGENRILVLCALIYLSEHNVDAFNNYFNNIDYEQIDKDYAYEFRDTEIVLKKEKMYYRKLLDLYVLWHPSPGVMDEANPYRTELLSLDGNKLGALIIELYSEPESILPLSIIWLAGEIGSSCKCHLYSLLLKEYIVRPSMRTACSIGSCVGISDIESIFEEELNEDVFREMLKTIFEKRWVGVQGLPLGEIKEYWKENCSDIRKDCVQRSVPQLG